eukprot:10928195-Ditylum_brightwellii.AAC.1
MQIEALITHIQMADSIGNTALIMLRKAQMAIGVGIPVLKDHGRLPHLEGGWVENAQDRLNTINAMVRLTEVWVMKPQRDGDQHIMEVM